LPSKRQVPRLGLTKPEAADSLGMSVDSFDRHVAPDLRVVRIGKLRIYPVPELEKWLDERAELTLDRRT
jgi:hypothetical protein